MENVDELNAGTPAPEETPSPEAAAEALGVSNETSQGDETPATPKAEETEGTEKKSSPEKSVELSRYAKRVAALEERERQLAVRIKARQDQLDKMGTAKSEEPDLGEANDLKDPVNKIVSPHLRAIQEQNAILHERLLALEEGPLVERIKKEGNLIRTTYPSLVEKYRAEIQKKLEESEEFVRHPAAAFYAVVPEDEIKAVIIAQYELDRKKKLKEAQSHPAAPPPSGKPKSEGRIYKDKREAIREVMGISG